MNDSHSPGTYYTKLHSVIRYNNNLNANAKILFSEIDFLAVKKGYCYATNGYFASLYNVHKNTISDWIKNLSDNGVIDIVYNKESYNQTKRKIYISEVIKLGVSKNTETGISKNTETGISENTEQNKTSINIYTTTKEFLSSNISLVENEQRKHKLNNEEVHLKIDEFAKFCDSIMKSHKGEKDVYSHFINWMNINANRSISKDIEIEIKWFMEMFNAISRAQFKPTKVVRELFEKRLMEGFTGPQMAKAVTKMYSSSPKNEWHIRTGFVNATPEFLLKNDNLNKYLNQRF